MQSAPVANGVWPPHLRLADGGQSAVAAAAGEPVGEPAAGAPSPATVKLFRSTVRSTGPALYARAVTLTRDRDEARDLVQDALLKALSSLHLFGAGTNMNAWLMRILTNLFIDGYRRRAARPPLVPLCDKALEVSPPSELEPPPLSARVSAEQVHLALEEIHPVYRQAYQLRVLGKLSYQDIARRLQIPVGTVGTRLARARLELRRVLTAREETDQAPARAAG